MHGTCILFGWIHRIVCNRFPIIPKVMKIYTHIIYKMPIPLVVLHQYLRQNETRHTQKGGGGDHTEWHWFKI